LNGKIETLLIVRIKMFVRVQPEDLVVGTKYKITDFPYGLEFDRYSGIFKKSIRGLAFTSLEFDYPYDLITKKMYCY